MVSKLSTQKYNGARGKAERLKKISEQLLRIDPEKVDAKLVWSTYGLDQMVCGKHVSPNPKSSNCKENPYCLGRLGMEKFEKLIKKSEDYKNEKSNNATRRDSETTPCGLNNFANFCYVNSFLQIWYNDPVFRQIIFDWRPSDLYHTPAPPAMDVQKVMNELQHLFFTLETTPYEDANAESFCKALRLNEEQQDAQEFSVLFFDSIDRNLMKHPNGIEMRLRIGERFNGRTSSILRCKCGHHSDNSTKFSAINLSIDRQTTLSGAFSDYFADERLDDFTCGGCNKKGGVTRETRMDHLPPVLLLSLNRYVYDSNTGRRKKIKTPIQYPRVLDVAKLFPTNDAEADSKYELSAVMVHEGDNAECGHYWDIIRHPYSGVWYKYNDRVVKETKPPGVEIEKTEVPSKPQIDLKFCYGLVYRRKEALVEQKMPPAEISAPWAKELENSFYRMTDTEVQASELSLQEVQSRFTVVGELMEAMEVKPEKNTQKRASNLAFLPVRLLTDLLSTEYERAVKVKEELENISEELDMKIAEEESVQSADRSPTSMNSSPQRRSRVRRNVRSIYDKKLEQIEIAMALKPAKLTLCPHGCISIDSVLSGEAKAVNKSGAESLLKNYRLSVTSVDVEGASRVDRLRTGLDVCTECVREYARDVHFKAKLDEDAALAARIHKDDKARCSIKAFLVNKRTPPEGSFYVSKSALASYKRDAQREHDRVAQANKQQGLTLQVAPLDTVDPTVFKRRKRQATENGGTIMATEDNGNGNRNGTEEPDPVEEPQAKVSRSEEATVTLTEEVAAVTVQADVDSKMREMVAHVSSFIDGTTSSSSASKDSSGGGVADDDDGDEEMKNGGEASEEEQQQKRETSESSNDKDGGRERSPSVICLDDENDNENADLDPIIFNEQLRCDHGHINISEFRHMVSREEWDRLTIPYFERAFECPTADNVCDRCLRDDKSATVDLEKSNAQLRKLNDAVGDMLKTIERRSNTPGTGNDGEEFTHGVCSRFIDLLRKALSSKSKTRAIPSICQHCLLCSKHGKPRYDLLPIDDSRLFIVPLTTAEWTRLRAEWDKLREEQEGSSTTTMTSSGTDSGGAVDGAAATSDDGQEDYTSPVPEIRIDGGFLVDQCIECYGELREQVEIARYVWKNQHVYVKLQTDEPSTNGDSGASPAAAVDNGSNSKVEGGGSATARSSPPVNGSSTGGSLAAAASLASRAAALAASHQAAATMASRSTTRRALVKKLIKVKMSSSQTVRELKIALLKQVHHSPVDQLLYSSVNGPPLNDDHTLMEARVLPENVDEPIILIVQTVNHDSSPSEPRVVERGFIDTALAH